MTKKILVIILLLIGISFGNSSCRGLHNSKIKRKQKKEAKIVEARKRKQKQDAIASYEKAARRHASIQTKDTRKKLKKNFKKAYRYNYNKKTPFWERWYIKTNHKKNKKRRE